MPYNLEVPVAALNNNGRSEGQLVATALRALNEGRSDRNSLSYNDKTGPELGEEAKTSRAARRGPAAELI